MRWRAQETCNFFAHDYNSYNGHKEGLSIEKERHCWSVAEAKAQLSSVIDRACAEGPQEITRHGQRTVVVVAADEWDRKTKRKGTLAGFLSDSPLRGSGLDIKRVRDKPRKVGL